MIQIEENPILFKRASTCQKILQLAGDHADEWGSMPEGLLCMMFALTFACIQYNISPRELTESIKKVRSMVIEAQKIAGKKAPISEVVFETGVN